MRELKNDELMLVNGGYDPDYNLRVSVSSDRASTPHIKVGLDSQGLHVEAGIGNIEMQYDDNLTNSGSTTPVRFRDYY